jgi:copper chaperone CopZ
LGETPIIGEARGFDKKYLCSDHEEAANMTTETPAVKRIQCPSCGKQAKRVSIVTMDALLKPEYAAQVATHGRAYPDPSGESCTPILRDTGWRYCDSSHCDLVYFAEGGDAQFTKSQLKVIVGLKEISGERPLCYCFGHSVASIKEELRAKGRSSALEDIRAKMKDPGCRCETENPSGSCCLGSVAKGIKIAQEELAMTEIEQQMFSPDQPSTSQGEKIAKIGTVVSAIVASSCCWLPLVLLAVGVSGAGIATTMEAYRPVFIVVTFGFLGAAFYFTYRPRKSDDCELACCVSETAEAADDCCAPSGKRRISMIAMNKIMLWLVTVLAVAFLLFPHYVGALLGANAGPIISADMNRTVVQIEGMSCKGCAAVAKQALESVSGVLAVDVNYESGEAVIGSDACCPLSEETIHGALAQVGYSGSFVE